MRAVKLVLVVLLLPHMLAAETVRAATFNVRNYLLTDRATEEGYRFEYPKPEAEKRALWAVIKEMDADVLALQEVGPEPYLLELRRDLAAAGVNYPYHAINDASPDERRVAVLSKIPFFEVKRVGDLEFSYFGERIPVRRGVLEVVFEQRGQRWTLYNVHLKSRFSDLEEDPESAERRMKEAREIRNYIRGRQPTGTGALFLVAGDFNDTLNSPPLRRFRDVGSLTLTEPVPAVDSRGETWTYYWRREDVYSRVDFILASPTAFERVKRRRGTIIDVPQAKDASDHRAVFIDFALPAPGSAGIPTRQ